ncbi:MAG: hypothetical protein ABIJ83_00740 [Patescibacteria group bacterium]|nr:hypothetical protein [Patescibacteria group bacterium]MBU0879537.1 hypothetical protein [Patescibacteria group bacterium]MBU0880331.1 hypothetical protein [Patescibacteria group bacterium]MBU1783247.1 hypothetical protein [Patescibacteria group bacterium]MBU2081410.1 hypothetical protein [Patescibacteria group bacterium]
MKKKVAYIIILFLIVINVFFAVKYFSLRKEYRPVQAVIEPQKNNEKILEFTEFFVKNVLKAKTKVDLETRLSLENMVKDLSDEEILAQWQKFVNSKTEVEAQNNSSNLLTLLLSKIRDSVLGI